MFYPTEGNQEPGKNCKMLAHWSSKLNGCVRPKSHQRKHQIWNTKQYTEPPQCLIMSWFLIMLFTQFT